MHPLYQQLASFVYIDNYTFFLQSLLISKKIKLKIFRLVKNEATL
jgi:hypothetical protein